jgi:hypothetical protein
MSLVTARSVAGRRVRRVLLDGLHVRDVVAADPEAGFIDVHPRDEKGRPLRDGDRLVLVRRHGLVKLEFGPR